MTYKNLRRLFTASIKLMSFFFFLNVMFLPAGWSQITLRGSSTVKEFHAAITIAKPAGVVENDIMIATISDIDFYAHNLTNATSSGWTLISGTTIGGGPAKHCTVLYKVATASEPASYTFTLPGAVTGDTYSVGGIVAFGGVDAADPFDTIGTLNFQPDHDPINIVTAPSITTTTNNCAVVMFCMEAYATGCYYATFSSWNTTSPGALAEIFDVNNNWGGQCAIGASWAIKPTPGVTGDGTTAITSSSTPRDSATWGAILIALKPPTTFPVSLLGFSAECNDGNINIEWSTASETNNNYFVLESSSNLNEWLFVAKVPGAGNSNEMLNYNYSDQMRGGLMYYRLTQIDFNGESETFDPVMVRCDESQAEVSCYPNPFTDNLVVMVKNIGAEQGSLVLHDVTGRVVMQRELGVSDFDKQSVVLSLSGISYGVYSLEFHAGSYSKTLRIIKNK